MNFVTGGTGLLGSHVLYELVQRETVVTALKRKGSNTDLVRKLFCFYADNGDELFSKVRWVEGELDDIYSLIDGLQEVETIYHCAALVSFDKRDRDELFTINRDGTARLVDAALDQGVKNFIYASSVAAIGRGKNKEEINEETQWKDSKNNGVYALTKRLAEMEVWRGKEEGLNVGIVNPTIILGPGDWRRSSLEIFKRVENGLRFYTKGVNGFVDVRDVARVMLKVKENKLFSERYITVGENMSYQKLFETMAKAMNIQPPSIHAKPWMTEIAWRLLRIPSALLGRSAQITKETSKTAHNEYYYSNKKIKEASRHEFYNMRESVDNAVAFHQRSS